MLLKKIVVFSFLLYCFIGFSQEKETLQATLITTSSAMKKVTPLTGKKLIPEKPREGEINPRRTDANKIVPGKGLPTGQDQLLFKQKNAQNIRIGRAPSLTFEANSSASSPSDPTGAIGPNHYVSAKNFAFAIHDRNGNVLVPSTSLANIFPGETLGDPIVFYDSFADRFVITQFSNSPNGFLVAVSQGPDPVNDGWFTYRFETGSFPDYTKFSIWSDGYYVTANKDQGSQQTSEVVYVIEREKMLAGAERAKMIGFPLPGARIGGFYSPASFNAIGNTLPPEGDAKIIYFQDDAWQNVSQDALKLWTINVDWINPDQSTITEAEELTVSGGDITSFDSTFDGGSFSNLPQPGSEGQEIDVLQGAVMFATNYRRFCDYNSVVLNFAVDIDNRPDTDNIAGIRWYELRQSGDGQPWTVYQEGTYTSPDGKSAWCASMAMDIFGNIGMGYTTMGTTANGANQDSFASIRYTGRLASDPLGTMTFTEENIAIGTDIQRNGRDRYGDYAQLTVDPTDDQTFWHIAEYFQDSPSNSRNIVGVFKIAPDVANDVGVISIDTPNDATFTNAEVVTITIKNFGETTQNNIPVSYSINGGAVVNEIFTGSIASGATASFSFNATADLTSGRNFTIEAETNLAGDVTPENDCASKKVLNLFPNDVGVVGLISPISGGGLSDTESITIQIQNYGGNPQSNIPVFYTLDGGNPVNETFTGTIPVGESAEYTFTQTANLLEFKNYTLQLGTALTTDEDTTNDSITRVVEHRLCSPTSNCTQFGDGITSFVLSNISNTNITCSSGYEDFTNMTINLDKAVGVYILTVQTGFASGTAEQLSLWIDFNDNAVFEESELLLSNEVIDRENTDQNFAITFGDNAQLGTHRLRIRAGDTDTNNGASLNDPCGSMQFGTTHDYSVEIGENTNPNTDLVIASLPNNQFFITMSDSNADQTLRINVFTLTGQTIVSNFVEKDANGRFVYQLDMSHASTGIYFVRLGSNKNGKSAKFAVQ
ncbi:GEVED domain-containing protein [Aquimarina sp. 2201CG5-10]|uniref:GEVED domain-containing protein n=1 Tax=Aquimarina callyspongiae TaxID=3098150 RepID=UPI002AB44B78|nr:GEVED domain-containing protein [Aquimarina sp. 2201CG5-10]MDY8135242.1 GEVED domain-containing protein [Aquimarina sp. 2201CG5-10]